MKKIGTAILVVLVILVAVFFITKNTIAKVAISGGVNAMTGLRLDIQKMNVGIVKTLVGIESLKLFNPSGYEDKVMIDLPEIYVDYDLGAFLNRKVHLEEVRLHLREFTVVKNEKGELNLNALKPVQEQKAAQQGRAPKAQGKKPQIQIDVLKLKVDRVVYKDYTAGRQPRVIEFNVAIDEQYENITDPTAFATLVVSRALWKTTVAKLTNFDLNALQDLLPQELGQYASRLGETAGDARALTESVATSAQGIAGDAKKAAEETVSGLKKLFPLGTE